MIFYPPVIPHDRSSQSSTLNHGKRNRPYGWLSNGLIRIRDWFHAKVYMPIAERLRGKRTQ